MFTGKPGATGSSVDLFHLCMSAMRLDEVLRKEECQLFKEEEIQLCRIRATPQNGDIHV